MIQKMQVYKCEECGNILEMLHKGEGELVCCGEPVKLLNGNSVDTAKDMHVPVIEKLGCGFRVKVGNEAHPMEEEHYIEWIEVIADNGSVHRQFLRPGELPEVIFKIDADKINVREYCNLHGLWEE